MPNVLLNLDFSSCSGSEVGRDIELIQNQEFLAIRFEALCEVLLEHHGGVILKMN